MFSPYSPLGNKNSERASNPKSYPLYTYLSRSAFLVNFTAPDKQSPSVNFVSLDHTYNL